MKMLEVTISDKLSVSDHWPCTEYCWLMRTVCACNKNSACTRRLPGRHTDSFPMCCKQVRLHTANAWWGFATVVDRQRVEAVIHRSVCSGLYRSDIHVWQQPNSLKMRTIICSSGFWGTRTTFCTLCTLTGDAVWNTNLDLAVVIEN